VIQLEAIRRPPIILYRLYQPCPKSMPINRTRLCLCEDKLSTTRSVKKKEKEKIKIKKEKRKESEIYLYNLVTSFGELLQVGC
jgi:hypothetical protein